MRWLWSMTVLMSVSMQAVAAEDIEAVLDRSQLTRMAQRPAANARSLAAQRVHHSLQRLLALPSADHSPVELLMVGGELFAEALLDRPGLVVSEAVGDLPEGQRLLLLAHELGHLRLAHARTLKALYRRYIPGEVRPETTDPAAAALGAQAHELSHRHELEADAYAYELVRGLGLGLDDAFALLTQQGMQHDSATHPGTRRRLAQFRSLESSFGQRAAIAAAQPGR